MASLTGSTIASSYEQLLALPDGGLNGNTLVAITDGDSSVAIGMKVATNKIEIIPGSDDANAFEVSKADGTAVLTVNTSTVGANLTGALGVTGNSTLTGNVSIISASSASPTLLIKNTNDDGEPAFLQFIKDTSNDAGANDEIVKMEFYHDNASNSLIRYGAMIVSTPDVTAGSEDTKIRFLTRKAGADTDTMALVSGNVGIGTTAPTNPLEVAVGAADESVRLSCYSTTTSHHGALLFTKSANSTIGTAAGTAAGETLGAIVAQGHHSGNAVKAAASIKFQGDAAPDGDSVPGRIIFSTSDADDAGSPTERMRIDDGGDVTVSTGDLVIGTAGKGISFAATADGTTMSSEVLSDYEEGIHTTAITGADTAGDFVLDSANQSLAYTKIGRMVTVQGKFQTSSGSGAGHLKISMPFTSNNGLDDSADISVGSITMNRTGSTSPSTQMTPIIFSNTNFVNIQLHNEGNANETYLQADDVDTSFEGQICISYIV